MKRILTIYCCAFLMAANAQNLQVNRDSGETVKVIKDPRFDELAAHQSDINHRAQKLLPKWVRGWRIQVSNSQDRNEANAVKAEMLRRFNDQKTYLLYQAPNFRVRVGDFLTQKDAFKLRKQIAALYPGKGIYIVPDTVEVAPEGDDADKPNE